jgi:membrane-associated phospholipid phosphatase
MAKPFWWAAALAIATGWPGVSAAQEAPPSAFKIFVSDVGHDYVNFVSIDNLPLALAGGTATAAILPADHEISEDLAGPTPYGLEPGSTYGNLAFQFPLAVTWWIVGHAKGSERAAAAGRDLVRAQISAVSWTYVIKYATDRTRPNGDPRSFPSGHASASFATAMVLQEYYGWKLGIPMFAVATYVGAERVSDKKHWPSDVVFGATIGLLAGRTVTLHVRAAKVSIQPLAVRGGGGVLVHVQP